jgi:hypothetical protein
MLATWPPDLVLHEIHKLQSSLYCCCLHYMTAVITLLPTSFSLFSAPDMTDQVSYPHKTVSLLTIWYDTILFNIVFVFTALKLLIRLDLLYTRC